MMTPESEALLARPHEHEPHDPYGYDPLGTDLLIRDYDHEELRRVLAAIEAAARKPLEERIAALEAALSTCGDYIVGLGLPCGTRLVWETEYLALLDLIDRLVTKPHGWLAALAQPAPAEEVP